MIDGDGRAHETVAGKDVVYDGSTVILTERRTDKCSFSFSLLLYLTNIIF